MIRAVRVGDQVCEDEDALAFYDTVWGRFIEVDGKSLFCSRAEFVDASKYDPLPLRDFKRMIGQMPVDWDPPQTCPEGSCPTKAP